LVPVEYAECPGLAATPTPTPTPIVVISTPTPTPDPGPGVPRGWILSEPGEACNETCTSMAYPCNATRIQELNEAVFLNAPIFELFAMNENINCSGIYAGTSAPAFDGISPVRGSGGGCIAMDPSIQTSVDCDAVHPSNPGVQRICCCGDEFDCPIENPTPTPTPSFGPDPVVGWQISYEGHSCDDVCTTPAYPCNDLAISDLNGQASGDPTGFSLWMDTEFGYTCPSVVACNNPSCDGPNPMIGGLGACLYSPIQASASCSAVYGATFQRVCCCGTFSDCMTW